jgi:hypothetical protein
LIPARVEIRDGLLLHDYSQTVEVAPSPELLNDFVGLAGGSPPAIRDFASKWGVLLLCEKHRLPASHQPGCLLMGRRSPIDGMLWEPLEEWGLWARQARALLEIAVNLHQDRVGSPANWRIVFEGSNNEPAPWWKQSPTADRSVLTSVVNRWLELGNVRLQASWRGRTPEILLPSPRLFPVLAVQLLFAIFRTQGLAVCSSCGAAYVPTRRPRPDRRNYCSSCGRKAAWRDAQRQHRSQATKRQITRGKTR